MSLVLNLRSGAIALASLAFATGANANHGEESAAPDDPRLQNEVAATAPEEADASKRAVFAGGCFWCIEADFEKLDGVIEARSGYSGGHVANPTYKQVTKGGTGHLEVVEVEYDPGMVSYRTLVDYFYRHVDPLDAGGQFCDRGDSYTTAIFVFDEEEQAIAEAATAKAAEELGAEIVTPIRTLTVFWPAEDYHQNYAKTHPRKYKFYRYSCGRDKRVKKLWG